LPRRHPNGMNLNNHDFWQLIKTIKDPVLIVNDSGVIQHVNPAVQQLSDQNNGGSLVGQPFQTFLPQAQVSVFEDYLRNLDRSPGAVDLQLSFADQTGIPVTLTGSHLAVDNEFPPQVMIVIKRRRELAEFPDDDYNRLPEITERRYSSHFDKSTLALMTFAPPDWSLKSANAAMQDLFGIENGSRLSDLKPWDLSPAVQPDGKPSREKTLDMIRLAEDTGSHQFEWTFKRACGEEFPAVVEFSKVELETGGCIQSTVRDISDRIRDERIILRQMKELELLNKLNSTANQGRDIRELLGVFTREVKRFFKGINAHIYLLGPDSDLCTVLQLSPPEFVRAELKRLLDTALPENLTIHLDERVLLKDTILGGKPAIVTDPELIQGYMKEMISSGIPRKKVGKVLTGLITPLFSKAGIKSIAFMPMISEGELIGSVCLVLPHVLSSQDQGILRSVSTQLCVILKRVQSEKERAASLAEMEFISRSLVDSARTESIDLLCSRLAENVLDVNPGSYVMTTLYDADFNAIRIRAIKGLGDLAGSLEKALGGNPEEILIDISENPLDSELSKKFTSGRLELLDGGLYDITRGAIPKKTCTALEEMAGVAEVYYAGFGLENESIGGLVLMIKEGQTVQYSSAIETVISHYAVIFDRRMVQEEVLRRKAQLEALRNVELEIASQLNLEELLQSIAGEARAIVNAAACGFSIYNPERDQLEVIAFTGRGSPPESSTITSGEHLSGKVWESKETLIVENYGGWEGRSEEWAKLGDYHLVGIPLMWGEEILGVLEIAFDIHEAISPAIIKTLELFATQAAIAVKNAHLFNDEMLRRQEAETLREVGLLINRMMDKGDLLEKILSALLKVVPYHNAAIFLSEENGLVVEAFQAAEPLDGIVGKWFKVSPNSPAHAVLNEGKHIVLDDVAGQSDLILGVGPETIHSWIAVPLELMGDRIGILTLEHREIAQYTGRDVNLAVNFANQATIAIENARLLKNAQEQQRETDTLRNVGMLISKSIDRNEAMSVILDQLQYVLEFTNATIQLIKGDTLVVEAVRGSDGIDSLLGTATPINQEKMLRSMLMEVEAVVIEDLQQLKDWASLPSPPEVHAWLGVPLEIQNKRIGILTIDHVEAGKYTEHDAELVSAFAAQAAISLENSRLFEEAQQRMFKIESLRQIDIAISGSVDLEISMNVLIRQLMTSLDVDGANVLIYNSNSDTLDYIAGHGFITDSLKFTSLPMGEGLAGKAAQERRQIHIQDISSQQTSLNRSPSLREEKFVSYIAKPLIAKKEVVGVLEVFHRSRLDPDQEWFDFLSALAGQAAIAIDRLNLYKDLEMTNVNLIRAYDATIEGWAKAIELRDGDTEGHSRRVVSLTLDLAKRMGINHNSLVSIRRGALLHDIGKMAVPDQILLKPGKLTDEEWVVMKEHPVHAYQMLSAIEYLQDALEIPYCHHERWDGSGYPRGLKGEEIPMAARIFAVVDVWDALRSDRPYRKAWPIERIIPYIREQSGTHFDPDVVEVFLEIVCQNEA